MATPGKSHNTPNIGKPLNLQGLSDRDRRVRAAAERGRAVAGDGPGDSVEDNLAG